MMKYFGVKIMVMYFQVLCSIELFQMTKESASGEQTLRHTVLGQTHGN